MIPKAVAMELSEGNTGIAKKFEQITMLYSDIKGFTNFAAATTPDKVITLLSKLFSAFDKLTEQHQVYKVQTYELPCFSLLSCLLPSLFFPRFSTVPFLSLSSLPLSPLVIAVLVPQYR
jgi:hypothetical protein